jgi:hypothetical protein
MAAGPRGQHWRSHVCGLASVKDFTPLWCWAVIIVFLPEVCSVDCGTHGVCIGGACRCEEGWTGAACDQRVCHPRCIEHGTCKDGKCECREGWNGEHCTIGRQTAGTETGTYCFIFINRRSIVTVAHCNWLFPQGHTCPPISHCLSKSPWGQKRGKARFQHWKSFSLLCRIAFWGGKRPNQIINPNQSTHPGEEAMHTHGKLSVPAAAKHLDVAVPLFPVLSGRIPGAGKLLWIVFGAHTRSRSSG